MNLSQRAKKFWILAAVFFMTVLAYAPIINNGFTYWDEEQYLLRNLDVRFLSFEGIKRIFSSTVFATYSPLTVLSFACEYHFFQYNPVVYHVTNLCLHLGVVFFVYVLGLRLGLGFLACILSTLIFAIHPIHVESVAWIVERKDVLYAFFYLAALCSYLKYVDEHKRRFYWLAVFFATASILSKAMALSLPLALLACEWVKGKKISLHSLFNKIPFFLVVVPVAAITFLLNARVPHTASVEALFIWIWTFVFYIGKFFFPVELLPLYQLPLPATLQNPQYSISFLAFVVIIALLFFLRKQKWFVFSILFYVCSVFFILRFDGKVDVSIVADRFMYLPCLGFCFLLGNVLEHRLNFWKVQNSRWRMPFVILCVALSVGLAAKTFYQCKVWQDAFSVWNYQIKKTPQEARAYDNLGAAYLRSGQLDMALSQLKKSAILDPKSCVSFNNIGLVYLAKKDFSKAVSSFQSAINVNPLFDSIIYNNLGVAFKDSGNLSNAADAFKKAIELDPRTLEARLNLSEILIAQDQKAQAEKLYLQNLAIDPSDDKTRFELINLYFHLKDEQKAKLLADKMIRDAVSPELMVQLGGLFYSANDPQRARACYQRAIKINPRYKFAYEELGKLLGNYEKLQAAIEVWQMGLRFYPRDPLLLDLIEQAKKLNKQ